MIQKEWSVSGCFPKDFRTLAKHSTYPLSDTHTHKHRNCTNILKTPASHICTQGYKLTHNSCIFSQYFSWELAFIPWYTLCCYGYCSIVTAFGLQRELVIVTLKWWVMGYHCSVKEIEPYGEVLFYWVSVNCFTAWRQSQCSSIIHEDTLFQWHISTFKKHISYHPPPFR